MEIRKYEHHEQSGTRLYHIYYSMLSRCYKESNIRYANYGGRGIEVCEEWKESFKSFYEWAIESGYTDELSIDRIDLNGNYEPSNCRWATICEQMNNTTRNRYIEHNGELHTMAEWALITGIPYDTINQRINTLKWSAEKALTTPKRNIRKRGAINECN